MTTETATATATETETLVEATLKTKGESCEESQENLLSMIDEPRQLRALEQDQLV